MLSIITFNCNGLTDVDKLQKIFSIFEEKRYGIILLQETFFSDAFVEQIKYKWNGPMFCANSNNGRQGVAILVRNDLKECVTHVENFEGRYVHIVLNMNGKQFNIFNVYAPNVMNDRVVFFDFLYTKLQKGYDNIILGGDFNTTLGDYDRSGVTKHTENICVRKIKTISCKFNLSDIWRNRNQQCSVFSRKQVRNGILSQSRIDYFLVSKNLSSFVSKIVHSDTSFSDHGYVNMVLDLDEIERGPGLWVLNNSFLHEDDYIDTITKLIQNAKVDEMYTTEPLLWWDNLKYKIKRVSKIYGKNRWKTRNESYYKIQNKLSDISAKLVDSTDNRLTQQISRSKS